MNLLLSAARAQTPLRPDPALWGLCEPDPLAPLITVDTAAPPDAPLDFTADFAESTLTETILEGRVEVEQGDRRLSAPLVSLDRLTNRITAEQGITYGDPTLAVRSNRAEIDLTEEFGRFFEAEYYIPIRNAQGSAELVESDRRGLQSRLQRVTFSTCERGRELWQFRARQVDIDEARGRGNARHMTLAIGDIPIMYFPYLSFPIDDERHSGFLFPRVGYDDKNGLDIRVPYYWNIAPQRDMTFTPRILSKRGLMLGVEYRFLYPIGRGEIDLEYLPDDRVRGGGRGGVNIRHWASPTPRLRTNLLYQHVSDNDYLEDFGDNLDLVSPTFLERRFDSVYYGGPWTALARLQGFQILDTELFADERPYSRLPQLLFAGAWPERYYGLSYDLRSELVYFHRDDVVTGARLDLYPGISLPLEWPAGFLTPRLSYRYTAYALQDTLPNVADTLTRGAPVLSLDSGLFFERPLQWRGWAGIQTLEPRLFYLYVPFRNQSDIPLFDTTEVDRSFAWLFLENRFTGADRLGDANQLTTALTSRLLDARIGRERLRASLGQIRFFQDRRVTLGNTAPEQDSRSEIFAELVVTPVMDWSVGGTLQWDPDLDNILRSALDLRYRSGDGRLVNIAYRFAREQLDQVDVSLIWPIRPHWQTAARWNYALRESRTLDAFVGLEYSECCWAVRMLARNRRDHPEDPESRTSVHLELVLKGLTDIGRRIDRILEDAILGFERTRY